MDAKGNVYYEDAPGYSNGKRVIKLDQYGEPVNESSSATSKMIVVREIGTMRSDDSITDEDSLSIDDSRKYLKPNLTVKIDKNISRQTISLTGSAQIRKPAKTVDMSI